MNRVQKSVLVPWEKYQHLIKQPPTHKDSTAKMTLCMVEEEKEPEEALSVDTVIEAVPKNVQNRVCGLLSHITNDGRLAMACNWSEVIDFSKAILCCLDGVLNTNLKKSAFFLIT